MNKSFCIAISLILFAVNAAGDDLTDILLAAESDNAQAQMVLGGMYEVGIGVARNNDKCAYWWQRASDNGHVNATKALGSMYFSGRGVPQDYQKAMQLYIKAAEGGHPHAIKYIALGYRRGMGLPKDEVKALEWEARARELHGPDADVVMLEAFESKETEVHSDAEIFAEFQRQADKGNSRAYFYMGAAYMAGVGTPQNYAKGVEWLHKAAQTNLSAGLADYAMVLQLGQGVPVNRVEAQKYLYVLDQQRPEEAPFMSQINAKYMSAEELAAARQLADEWLAASSS